jgi:hypothetical protein
LLLWRVCADTFSLRWNPSRHPTELQQQTFLAAAADDQLGDYQTSGSSIMQVVVALAPSTMNTLFKVIRNAAPTTAALLWVALHRPGMSISQARP